MKESDLQKQIVSFFRNYCPEVIVVHVPNGQIMNGVLRGLLGKQKASVVIYQFLGFLRSMGMYPGWPDLQILWAPSNILLIEVKKPASDKKNAGKLSDDQKDLHPKLTAMAFDVATVDSLEGIYDLVRGFNIPCKINLSFRGPQ